MVLVAALVVGRHGVGMRPGAFEASNHGHVGGTRQVGNLVIKNENAFAGSPLFSSTSSTRFGGAGDRLGDFKGDFCTDVLYEFTYVKFTKWL